MLMKMMMICIVMAFVALMRKIISIMSDREKAGNDDDEDGAQ